MATNFEVDQLYQEILNRPLTQGEADMNVYANMTPEEVREYLVSSPEGQFQAQAQESLGRPLGATGVDYYMNFAKNPEGLEAAGVTDNNQDGVVNINDLLMNIATSPEAQMYQTGAEDRANQALVDAGFAPTYTSYGNELTPYYADTVNMQLTGGLQTLPTTGAGGFYGINPLTGMSEFMTDRPENLVFRSGVQGFTDTIPTALEFGIPKVFADVPVFFPQSMEDFEAYKKEKEAESRKNRYQFQGMGSDFDQSKLGQPQD